MALLKGLFIDVKLNYKQKKNSTDWLVEEDPGIISTEDPEIVYPTLLFTVK